MRVTRGSELLTVDSYYRMVARAGRSYSCRPLLAFSIGNEGEWDNHFPVRYLQEMVQS